MAHNIYKKKMFYTGERPWHGIGTELANPATAEEAIAAAKLDYKIELQQIRVSNGKTIQGRKATVVKETGVPLGIVSKNYKIIQNTDAFGFFDSVVGGGKAIYHTAGALGAGERIWILAKLPKNSVIKKVDEVEKFLLLTNSHDGRSSLRMFFTPIRVVCQNTLNMALGSANGGISIKHIGSIEEKIEEAQRALGIATLYYTDFEKMGNAMAEKKLSVEEATLYFSQVLGIDKKDPEEVSTRAKKKLGTFVDLFENGKGANIPEVKHSLWTAYNAVAEYTDHFQTVKNLEENKSAKLNSIWFGSAAGLKDRAFSMIPAMLK